MCLNFVKINIIGVASGDLPITRTLCQLSCSKTVCVRLTLPAPFATLSRSYQAGSLNLDMHA